MKITVTHDDGETVDITEGVQVVYDSMFSWMASASGYLDHEEAKTLAHLSKSCRFSDAEERQADVEATGLYAASQRERELRRQEQFGGHLAAYPPPGW